MLRITFAFLLFRGVFSQYEFNDNEENVDSDFIRNINNLAEFENSATQSNLEKNVNLPETVVDRNPSDVFSEIVFRETNSSTDIVSGKKYNTSDTFSSQHLVINVAQESELLTVPGKSAVIVFEVTNYKNTTLDVIFYCTTQQSEIYSLTPSRIQITPKETVKLRLTLRTKPITYQDEIILTANTGPDNTEKKVLIDVGTYTEIDNTAPSLEYSFLSNCSQSILSDCNRDKWAIQVKAKDTGSGLLRLTTNFKDLYFSESFTIGSKELITGTYSESCCNMNLEITAIDRAGNKKELNATVNHARLSRLIDTTDYNSNVFPQQSVFINVAQGSELITSPNKSPVIKFEVTNYRNSTLDVIFYCTTQQSNINFLNPTRAQIGSQETIKLQLGLGTKATTYQDEITLIANAGADTVEKKVLVDVGTQTETDNTAPSVDYSFLSDCSKIVFANCLQGTWTIEVKSRDTQSGLQQLVTNPKGIYFSKGFTTGTKDEVTGTYSESCCNADLQITATDRAGNRKQVQTNAYRATWGPGQIAAVVLGVLLLIAIIILAAYFIRKLIKKKEKYGLATYRSGGGKSTATNYE